MRVPAFNMGAHFAGRKPGFSADVLFRPAYDDYGGVPKVKWEIKDVCPAEAG